MSQHAFQLKKPKNIQRAWKWPREVPDAVVFDPASTVSATYGVAFPTQFRGGKGPWSSRPTIFVIDKGGVLRYTDSRRDQDIREPGIFPILDDLEEQRRLITGLRSQKVYREAGQIALAPLGPRSKAAI